MILLRTFIDFRKTLDFVKGVRWEKGRDGGRELRREGGREEMVGVTNFVNAG